MVAQASNGNSGSPVRDPKAGTVLPVAAGGQTEIVFNFVNHAPFAAAFYLEVEGLPDRTWTSGNGPDAGTVVAAHGGGALTLVVFLPAGAPPNKYNFLTRIVTEGQIVSEVPLVLAVRKTASSNAEALDLADSGTVADISAPSTVKLQDTRLPDEASDTPTSDELGEMQYTVEGKALPLVELPRRVLAEIATEAEDGVAASEAAPHDFLEPFVLNPKAGTVLASEPGETLLLRFGFTNDTPSTRTFIIEEDRSLESEWITMVQDEVNLTTDESDELLVRLHPPVGAKPGDYPFMVRIGPENGVLTSCNLTLTVEPTPAVQLKALAPLVTVGPFWRHIDFGVSIESAGNTDTAFRLAVKAPFSDVAVDGPPRSDDIYESAHWQYFFDKEMDSLDSLTPNRPPKPRPGRLRVMRRGIWWWGFQERHKLHVAAIPVTDPSNHSKIGNTLELTAVRWRPYPLPLLILLPLLVLPLLLLFCTAQDLMVDNPTYIALDGTNYIVAQPANGLGVLQARIQWQAPPLSLLTLSATGDKYQVAPYLAHSPHDVSVLFPVGQRSLYRVYNVDRYVGGGGPQLKLKFIAARDDTPLAFFDAYDLPLTDNPITLIVPGRGWASFSLKNMARQDFALNYWVVKRPGPAFLVSDLNDEGSLKPVVKYGAGANQIVKILPGPMARAGLEDELVLITTDLKHPVVYIKLKLVGGTHAALAP